MAFESFYGGRQGASFIIVKQFDGIDIPQRTGEEVYKVKSYITTPDRSTYYYDFDNNTFIERDGTTYKDYTYRLTTLNGEDRYPVISLDGTQTGTVTVDLEEAEGMVQCFALGGASTNEVNYGEYVIIDTPDKRNPDNGKVFRRGLDYQGEMHGAEYIGQIVGPEGDAPELYIQHYEDVQKIPNHTEFTYDVDHADITPGSYIDDDNIRQYTDAIQWASAIMKDEFGNVIGCQIGFKMPTLVMDFEATSIDPYSHRVVPEEGEPYDVDLIEPDSEQYINKQWVHPFYHKWQLKIPHGYHGIDSTQLCIVHTKTMPKDFKYTGYAGTPVYTDSDCTTSYIKDGSPLVLVDSVSIRREGEGVEYDPTMYEPIYDPSPTVISCSIDYDDQILYVKKEDCYMDVLRYREIDWESSKDGIYRYYYFSDNNYNIIKNIEVQDDGSVIIAFSGLDSPVTIEKAIDWITGVSLNQEGNFEVLFNNDSIMLPGQEEPGRYRTVVQWIDFIVVNEDGSIDFYFNTDHENPVYTSFDRIKYISDINIQTTIGDNEEEGDEGSGDQRIHIDFNTGESAVIGNPLNYIIESTISTKTLDFPNAPYSHLLVYYSDPALRRSLQDKWVSYPSQKYPGKIWDEWVDLGNVRGAAGGVHILTDVDDPIKLYDGVGQAIPPEKLVNSQGEYIDPTAFGWCVTVTYDNEHDSILYFFDYDEKDWYSAGTIDVGFADPTAVIIKSAPQEGTQEPDPVDVTSLRENGLWLASEIGYCVE